MHHLLLRDLPSIPCNRLLAVMDGGELERELSFTVSHDTKTVVKQTNKKMNNLNKKEKISENLLWVLLLKVTCNLKLVTRCEKCKKCARKVYIWILLNK